MDENNHFTYKMGSNLQEIDTVMNQVNQFAEDNALTPKALHVITICLDEVLNNIVSYSFQDDTQHHILIDIVFTADLLTLKISDNGVAFNPLDYPEPEMHESIEEATIGGLGIHLVKNLSDSLSYAREDQYNILTIKKQI